MNTSSTIRSAISHRGRGATARAALLLVVGACAGDDLGISTDSIINGEPASEAWHDAVVGVETVAAGNTYVCTGTLITESVVLTAAHCVHERKVTGVIFGTSFASDERREVTEVGIHPEWDPTLEAIVTDGHDIALLRLASPAPGAIEPVPPLPSSIAATAADIGAPIELVGFGNTGADAGDGGAARLRGFSELAWVCEDAGGCTVEHPALPGGLAPLAQDTLCYRHEPSGTCTGDSGGPLILERDGVRYVAGVLSYVDKTCSALGCNTKVDAYHGFIDSFLDSPDGEPNSDPPTGGTAGSVEACVDELLASAATRPDGIPTDEDIDALLTCIDGHVAGLSACLQPCLDDISAAPSAVDVSSCVAACL